VEEEMNVWKDSGEVVGSVKVYTMVAVAVVSGGGGWRNNAGTDVTRHMSVLLAANSNTRSIVVVYTYTYTSMESKIVLNQTGPIYAQIKRSVFIFLFKLF
jgi:hypothetical protein